MQQLSFIRSVVCLATGPWTLRKLVLHRLRAGASSFNIQYPIVFERSSSGCLYLPSRLPVTSNFPPISHSLTCFRRQFYAKCDQFCWISFFSVYIEYTVPSSLYVIHHSSHHRPKRSFPSFFNTIFQTFPGISELLFEVSKFYHHTIHTSGFGGLGIACWPLVPKFAGSNPAEAFGFFGRKNPQHAFLRRGSKAVGLMS